MFKKKKEKAKKNLLKDITNMAQELVTYIYLFIFFLFTLILNHFNHDRLSFQTQSNHVFSNADDEISRL